MCPPKQVCELLRSTRATSDPSYRFQQLNSSNYLECRVAVGEETEDEVDEDAGVGEEEGSHVDDLIVGERKLKQRKCHNPG